MTTHPAFAPSRLRIRCHLKREFRLSAETRDGVAPTGGPGLYPTWMTVPNFHASLTQARGLEGRVR